MTSGGGFLLSAAARASFATTSAGLCPARNADPDLLKYKNKSRSQSR
jgi:hypothetical protein